MSAISTVALLGSMIASVSAHGHISGIVAGGQYYPGAVPSNQYQSPPPDVVGWYADNQDNGFVDGSSYTNTDIVCHKSATPGQVEADVVPGDTVELQWSTVSESTTLSSCEYNR